VNRLRDLGKEVIIVESDAQTTNADKAWIASGMEEMGKRLGVPFLNMRHVDEKVELDIKGSRVLKKIKVAKIATESAIVSAAKLKTHMSTNVTLGMKNMFVQGKVPPQGYGQGSPRHSGDPTATSHGH